jgi:hypothetical protein
MRDPSPEFAERLATGVGDLATGLAGVLRAFGTPVHPEPDGDGDDVWHAATAPVTEPAQPQKRTVKKAVKKADAAGTGGAL